jgi:aspartate/methionine/tyrosine aminotransferase
VFAPVRYIDWALQHYGKVPFDLASSGVPHAKLEGLLPPGAALDDAGDSTKLRAAIARYNAVDESEVVATLGTSHAVFLAYAAMLEPGDEILVEAPGYEPLTRTAEGLAARVRTFARHAHEGYRIVPERVAAAMTPRTRAIVLTSLHNPSGVHTERDVILELARIAEAQGAYVLVDEVYAPLLELPDRGVLEGAARTARTVAPNVIAVSSLTKCYGLGLHRVGWMLGPPEIVSAAERAMIATCGHLPSSHAAVATALFGRLGGLARRAEDILSTKRELAEAWVASAPRLRWSAPRGGLFALVTLETEDDLLPRIEQTAREAGVLVGAGSFFGVPNGFRLSWATCTPELFREGLARLGSAIARW